MSRRHLSHPDTQTEISHRVGVLAGALDALVDLLDQPNGRALDGQQRDDLSCLIETCASEAASIHDLSLQALLATAAPPAEGGAR